MPNCDPFDLQRFVTAQNPVFATVLEELRAGRKCSHWMWFIFPQLRALGRSPTAQFYGITSLDEARAYLAHPILAPRLVQATEALLTVQGRTLHEILGSPDDLKFRSSMTLFAETAGEAGDLYRKALDRYCDGRPDEATLRLLG
ncbi:calpastatin [Azospirillum sp. TSH100]|uniref:DUF1810 domain-containing protein n=1 Tax=Azospirillum sp. TSH100 TaxID=652764 RepID=UPI000D611253|nr:calpastatin [Azospirillum sp. TSH100]QCG90740.1 DUF1810 domain-containing protein [Azospirillum sp. TSH100]